MKVPFSVRHPFAGAAFIIASAMPGLSHDIGSRLVDAPRAEIVQQAGLDWRVVGGTGAASARPAEHAAAFDWRVVGQKSVV